jgi:hypothetical protein
MGTAEGDVKDPRSGASVPKPKRDDPEDTSWALSTAEAMWTRGEHADAIKWIRRAAEAASEADADERALELAKCAADLASLASELSPNTVENPSPGPQSDAKTVIGRAPSFPPMPAASPVAPIASGTPAGGVLAAASGRSRPPTPSNAPPAPSKTPSSSTKSAPPRPERELKKLLDPEIDENSIVAVTRGPEDVTRPVHTPTRSRPSSEPRAPAAEARTSGSEPRLGTTVPALGAAGYPSPGVTKIPMDPDHERVTTPAPSPRQKTAPADDMDDWPTQAIKHDELAELSDERTRLKAESEAPRRKAGVTQAMRVVMWKTADGVQVAPAGTKVKAPTMEALIVTLDPDVDLTTWLRKR